MNHETRYAKPGAGTPGFAQSTWRLVAFLPYRIGRAGAIACLPLLLVAVAGAGLGRALFWEGEAMSELKNSQTFKQHRPAALALLNSPGPLTWKAGQFLGGIAVSGDPLSERQADWLNKLLRRAGLPSYEGGAHV